MFKETLLNALGEFYNITLTARNFKNIQQHYLKESKRTPDLNLAHLLGLLSNTSTSDKALRLALDDVIYPIENKRSKGEPVCERLLLFSQVMEKEIYNVQDEAQTMKFRR